MPKIFCGAIPPASVETVRRLNTVGNNSVKDKFANFVEEAGDAHCWKETGVESTAELSAVRNEVVRLGCTNPMTWTALLMASGPEVFSSDVNVPGVLMPRVICEASTRRLLNRKMRVQSIPGGSTGTPVNVTVFPDTTPRKMFAFPALNSVVLPLVPSVGQ